MSTTLMNGEATKKKTEIIGVSQQAAQMREFAEHAACTEQTLLLRGETGVGKDHLAECIHKWGRSDHQFVPIDCGAMPETLCESELFGHRAGAFTDARYVKVGLVQAAQGGTLFLNEVANMSNSLQAKFLRVLDTKTFRPVGEIKEIPMETRIITATNANIERLVKENRLRHDLYYRLNVVAFTICPLRERAEDIPHLAEYFLRRSSQSKRFSSAAMDILQCYSWPGNVRELKHAIERAVFFSGVNDIIESTSLSNLSRDLPNGNQKEIEDLCTEDYLVSSSDGSFLSWNEFETKMTRAYFLGLISEAEGNKTVAATISGLCRKTIRYKMQKHHVSGNFNND